MQAPPELPKAAAPASSDSEQEFAGGFFDEDAGGVAWEAAALVPTPTPAPRATAPKRLRKGGCSESQSLRRCLSVLSGRRQRRRCWPTPAPRPASPKKSRKGVHTEAFVSEYVAAPALIPVPRVALPKQIRKGGTHNRFGRSYGSERKAATPSLVPKWALENSRKGATELGESLTATNANRRLCSHEEPHSLQSVQSGYSQNKLQVA